jgi:predicted kinase
MLIVNGDSNFEDPLNPVDLPGGPSGRPWLFITRGAPASGKSTVARQIQEKHPERVSIVEKDKIRSMFGGYAKDREYLVHQTSVNTTRRLLESGQSVVVSDTNLPNKTVRSYLEVASELRVNVWVINLTNVPLEELHRRNEKRLDARNLLEDGVPPEVIDTMYNKFIKGRPVPLPLPEVHEEDRGWEKAADWHPGKGEAYIFDIDGTLALMGDRSPYDTGHTLLNDEANRPVVHVYKELQFAANGGLSIILLSGRSEDAREVTEQWLEDKGIVYDKLYMRASGDMRKDDQVKYELFKNHVEPYFNVLGVFDDRNQVVRMWRQIGLTCFQVADGNF